MKTKMNGIITESNELYKKYSYDIEKKFTKYINVASQVIETT